MTPRANFVCQGKKCRTPEGQAPTFESGVDAKFCPACGSKRITRLFDKVGVLTQRAAPEVDWRMTGTSLPRRADAMLTESFDHHAATRPAREMPAFTAGAREQEINMPGGRRFVLPSAQDAAAMVLGPKGGAKGHAMEPLEIARAVRNDRLSVPSVLGFGPNGGRTVKPLPTVSAGTPKA